VLLPGAGAPRAGVMGVVAACGAGEAGAGWDAGPTGALAESGVVAGVGRVAAFGMAIMSATGTPGADAVGAVLRGTCPSTMLWLCCWYMTRVVKTPTMATAIAKGISRDLFDRAQ
jgi:hypothetical protein